ncbi:helix-turn-helix domain-containing protein [Bradyrhizobium lablabi]|uniref:helix-turn-helix domain-containing protein n=1 Tax=Bradyrhizobium lablabi TaxID=722472 RepID=UPI001BA5FCEC|nr:AraC family transcriptional regulator [Bradyrhizobium lablabi]MBR0692753.1 helix-turn-helix transcriptional regulator [Bradyrhizobium lablabi]
MTDTMSWFVDHGAALANRRRQSDPSDGLARGQVRGLDDEAGIFEEVRWREPKAIAADRRIAPDITVSRWATVVGGLRNEQAITPEWCHIITVALKASRLSLSADSRLLFEGSMAPGTIHISAPGQHLRAQFVPPFDFLHLHVDNNFLDEAGLASRDSLATAVPLLRDPLVEALSRSLLNGSSEPCRRHYVESVGKAIVMRAMARPENARRCSELPKWRMKRLEQYLSANIHRPISLGDMAAVAGLSKMHFAAQFRAATGFRPHEYLLLKRVEHAKAAMLQTTMPLVEVAFSVGFNAQAHFSTVFKRFTGMSPARWKQEYQNVK